MSPDHTQHDRRSVLKAAGVLGASPLLGLSGTGGGDVGDAIDDALDPTSGDLQEALVVFDSNDRVDALGRLDLAEGFLGFDVLPVAYALLTGSQIETVAGWDGVRYVEANRDLAWHNATERDLTGVSAVQSGTPYTGESVHAVVIDSGVDGDHPDLADSIAANYQWLGNPLGAPTLWAGAGSLDTDEIGHGTHVSGTIAGDGSQSGGKQRGMAPGATLTVYSTSAGLSILKAAAAYDHMLAAQGSSATYHVVSNSYGAASSSDYNPDGTLQTATWEAFDAGILPVFSAGNSGPGTDTINDFAKAPHVLSVAATDDEKAITDFSSRGRGADAGANYDRQTALGNLRAHYDGGSADGPVGLYRNGVAGPGKLVDSTMAPTDPLQADNPDLDPWYGRLSGTSMSCPVTSGTAALVLDAYYQEYGSHPDPMAVLNTIEATAYEARAAYTPANAGAGFLAADDAVARAGSGDLASFDDVTLTDP